MQNALMSRNAREGRAAALVRSFTSPDALTRFALTLPQKADAQRFAYSLVSAIEKTPRLAECNPEKLWLAAVEAAHLGLPVSGAAGLCYLIPYKGTPTLVMGYKGMIALAKSEGLVTDIYARVVYDCDGFDYMLGTSETIKHRPNLNRPQGAECIAAYACAVTPEGFTKFEIVSRDELDATQKRSRAQSGPWVTDTDEMRKKTAIRRLCKTLGMGAGSKLGRAVELDDLQDAGKAQNLGHELPHDATDPPSLTEDEEKQQILEAEEAEWNEEN